MDVKELDKIVKICVKFGVSELKIGDTHVIFGEVSKPTRKPRKAAIKQQEEDEKEALLQKQLDLISDEVSVSHLEDPVGFEESLLAGELKDEEPYDRRTQ